jgi:hypothetical protein
MISSVGTRDCCNCISLVTTSSGQPVKRGTDTRYGSPLAGLLLEGEGKDDKRSARKDFLLEEQGGSWGIVGP